jgi:hypothetical protein
MIHALILLVMNIVTIILIFIMHFGYKKMYEDKCDQFAYFVQINNIVARIESQIYILDSLHCRDCPLKENINELS